MVKIVGLKKKNTLHLTIVLINTFFSAVTVQSIYFQPDILKTSAKKYSTSIMFLKVKC